MRTRIISVKLWKWFPSNDDLAKKIARLCIFREDLMFELHCEIESINVSVNDDYGSSWRQFYYFRKMFSTVTEIRRAIESLANDRSFKYFLANQSPGLQREFKRLKKQLDSERENMKTIRNEIAVHIEEHIVGEALQNMDAERWGFLHISQSTPRKTHYKFAGELIMAIMLRNTPNDKQLDRANEIVGILTNTTKSLFSIIDWIFFNYSIDRKLL